MVGQRYRGRHEVLMELDLRCGDVKLHDLCQSTAAVVEMLAMTGKKSTRHRLTGQNRHFNRTAEASFPKVNQQNSRIGPKTLKNLRGLIAERPNATRSRLQGINSAFDIHWHGLRIDFVRNSTSLITEESLNQSNPSPQASNDAGSDQLVYSDGTPVSESNPVSQRSTERKSEDDNYIPVIIKRTDETRRHPDDALENAIEEGLEQLDRPALSLVLSAIAAGLIVGFSAMAVAVVLTATGEANLSATISRIATAFVYPLGFVVCVLSGAQLFTEHTATALYPILDRKAKVVSLLRLWGLVVLGNLIGACAAGGLQCLASEVIHAKAGYIEIGHHLTKYSSSSLLISAILAGWLMALGAWLVGSSPRTIAQIAVIYIVTFLIGMGGLHHSIAGSVEMFAAMFLSEEFTIPMAARFISVALVGNLIGGSIFVALLNYAHIRRTNDNG